MRTNNFIPSKLIFSELIVLLFTIVGFIPIVQTLIIKIISIILNKEMDFLWWHQYFNNIFANTAGIIIVVILLQFFIKKYNTNVGILKKTTILFFVGNSIFTIIFELYNKSYRHTRLFGWDFAPYVISGYGEGSLYGTNYPPLAVLIYRLCHFSMPPNATWDDSLGLQYCFLIISAALIFHELFILCNNKWLVISMFLSTSLLISFEALNFVLISFYFLMLFLNNYEKDKGKLSNLSLAISANIKFYPALYGILLLKNKKYKQSIVCVILGILLFVIPAFLPTKLFSGEQTIENKDQNRVFSSVDTMIESSNAFVDYFSGDESMSIRGVCMKWLPKIGLEKEMILKIGNILTVIVAIVVILFILVSKKKFEELALIGLFFIAVVPTSFGYYCIFLIPAFLNFLKENHKESDVLLYIPFILSIQGFYQWVYILLFLICINVILENKKLIKCLLLKRKQAKEIT